MPKVNSTPEKLRPYLFHGLDLRWRSGDKDAKGDCPWCGKEGKFSVSLESGKWHCFVCGEGSDKGGGNLHTFLRTLWDRSDKATNGETKVFAAERGLLYPETLTYWGVCKSVLSGNWLVPGHGADGHLNQLYQRIRKNGKWLMMPTPTLEHQLHGVPLFDKKKGTVYLHESWGNALAFWETGRAAKMGQDAAGQPALTTTGNEASSILADASVLAVANCGACGDKLRRFLPLFAGKRLVLMFDSDHPRQHQGKRIEPAGWAASRRAAACLGEAASEVLVLRWGEEGHDPGQPSGHDVREVLSAGATMEARVAALEALLGKIVPVPADWAARGGAGPRHAAKAVEPEACRSWRDLLNVWRKALRMRRSLEDVLAVMLAVALSTEQVGDQLFLQVIGDAGSAKTRLCDAMLVSKKCYPLEHLTGFHSGWKDSSGEDFSLLARINRKTMITPEGDVLMSSPKFIEIMSQQRRMFDGISGASFKNRKEDMRYTGLRTPWIMAGTPALLDTDQSRLGDRFLRVVIDRPTPDEQRDILRRAGFGSLRAVDLLSDGKAETQTTAELHAAYAKTGGYVDWLRANASDLLQAVKVDEDMVVDRCAVLAEWTADMRASPHPDHKREVEDTKEVPSRLVIQFCRLAKCLAVVMNRKSVDATVLERVKKVAIDTARGRTLALVKSLAGEPSGMSVGRLAGFLRQGEDRTSTRLRFLSMPQIGVVKSIHIQGKRTRWILTDRLRKLNEEVMA